MGSKGDLVSLDVIGKESVVERRAAGSLALLIGLAALGSCGDSVRPDENAQ